MKKRIRLLLSLVLSVSALHAQDAVSTAPAVPVALGHAVVALTGPWKFHIGDDPRWADPKFDDSSWETVDLGAKEESIDPIMGTGGYSPGWTAKGHPGYAGFAWYRIRLRISGADGPLAVLSPTDFDDSYQLFADGRLAGSFGKFDRPLPAVYYSYPVMFALPEGGVQHGSGGSSDGSMLVAFRFYMAPEALLLSQRGGLHSPPVLGLASAVTAAYHVALEELYRGESSAFATGIMNLAFALLILMLYAFDRTETILLWPLGACVLGGLVFGPFVFVSSTQAMTMQQLTIAQSLTLRLCLGLWLMTWWTYFGLQDRKWIRNAIGVLVVWNIATSLLFPILLFGGDASHGVFVADTLTNYAGAAAEIVLLVLIAYFGWRRPQRAGWPLFLALCFYILPDLQPGLDRLHIRTVWFPFGTGIRLDLISIFAVLLCFSLVLLGRFRNSQRRQAAMEEDVQQAQQVQQVLIPEQLPQVSGLTIESEYRPAREVGGDFFQILPHATDGSVLVVAGDVTGKGLQAGMLVALIVGTIRTTAQYEPDALAILRSLNQRLCGRGHAHATCLALRIEADGAVTLANAGHLPPYLNGKELPMEGAVPLGMTPDAAFTVMSFQLEPGDRLMLLSDGVAEAQGEDGKLFGFDRVHELLKKQISAAEIATAAQNFGQQDDISVLSVTRSGVREAAMAGVR
jgi:hypothetical protein